MQRSYDEDPPPAESGAACGRGAQRCSVFPAVLLLVLAGIVAFWAIRRGDRDNRFASREIPRGADGTSTAGAIPSPVPDGETVSLAVDFGNGVTRSFAALPWREGMTVAAAMAAATEFQPGLTFSHRGDGPMMLLTAIDGVAAEGREGRNWIVYVGGARCQTGVGVQRLDPGDAILWKYEPYE